PSWERIVLRATAGVGTVVRRIPMTSDPVGMGIHAASPNFVLTNNQDGTVTRVDFVGDDYTAAATTTTFASGGFRGDLMQAGPDGCLYLTQDGVRNQNGDDVAGANSVVQLCGGFVPAAGITAD